jgi:hypothetical protein
MDLNNKIVKSTIVVSISICNVTFKPLYLQVIGRKLLADDNIRLEYIAVLTINYRFMWILLYFDGHWFEMMKLTTLKSNRVSKI